MANLLTSILAKWRGKPRPISSVEKLRTLFKARYHNFKLLLSANNKALEIMADLEEALRVLKAEHVEKYIAMVNLTPARDKKPSELSGGMRQRVSVAQFSPGCRSPQ